MEDRDMEITILNDCAIQSKALLKFWETLKKKIEALPGAVSS